MILRLYSLSEQISLVDNSIQDIEITPLDLFIIGIEVILDSVRH